MESAKRFENKIGQLLKTIDGFSHSMNFDLSNRDMEEIDLIKNGQIQKFEYTLELFWKTTKAFLYEIHGIDCGSLKSCIRALFQNTDLSEADYETLIHMVNCRNNLSHIYNEESFNEIYNSLNSFIPTIDRAKLLFRKH